MTINIDLSEESVNEAIRRLRVVQQNLRFGTEDLIAVLVKNGEAEAQRADGGMANVIGYVESEKTGRIVATGGDSAMIAEFGAGDATLNPTDWFTVPPDTPVYPGSYSELVGTREYYESRMMNGEKGGVWHFGGQPFHEVKPRQGLYKAKRYIIENAASVAREVIKL